MFVMLNSDYIDIIVLKYKKFIYHFKIWLFIFIYA